MATASLEQVAINRTMETLFEEARSVHGYISEVAALRFAENSVQNTMAHQTSRRRSQSKPFSAGLPIVAQSSSSTERRESTGVGKLGRGILKRAKTLPVETLT
jgi:hypothetical protein